METLSEKITGFIHPDTGVEVSDNDSTSEAVVKELKEVFYSTRDLQDFEEFRQDGLPVDEGEVSFCVDCKYLKYACGVLKHTYTGSKLNPNLIKITIFKTQLKITGFTQTSFGTVFIPLSKQAEFPNENISVISFIFDYPTLAKITNSFGRYTLNFNYRAEKKLLEMDCGKTHLELITRDYNDFTHFLNTVKEIKEIDCSLHVETLQSALNYLSLFIKKESSDITDSLALFECRDSALVGGNMAGIGIIQAESLKNIPLKIKHETVPTVLRILPYFYSPNMKLFETDTYYILRDQNLYLGIEKTDLTFPPLKHLLTAKTEESYIIPRNVLLQSLQKLSVVTEEKEALLYLQLAGRPPQSTLTLSVKDITGRRSKDILQVMRQDIKGAFPDQEYYVNLNAFEKTLAFFKEPEVHIQEIKDKAILIRDNNSLFSCITMHSIAKEV